MGLSSIIRVLAVLSSGLFRVEFTRHARRRMAERGISVEEVYDALNQPIQVVYDRLRDAYISVSPRGCGVVYKQFGKNIIILTVLGRREYEVLTAVYGRSRYKVVV